jgi:phosphatidylglycerophosphate synthase
VVTGSAVALTVAGVLARRSAAPLDLVLDSLADRTFDAAVLGAIAWGTREGDPATSLGALIALAAGFLGSYVRAKGASLGYGVVESPRTRAFRYGVIAIGLLVDDGLRWSVWAAAVVSILASLVRSSQVAKEERA